MAVKMVNLILRGLEFFWTLLIMALVGNMIAEAIAGNPSVVNYTMFTAVFSMLSLIYLVAATYNEAWSLHPMLMIAVDILNVFFFFTCAIAMSAELTAHSCTNMNFTMSNHITNGSLNPMKRCQEAQASTAFLWFGFVSYAASAVLSGLQSRGAGTARGGISRSGPSMTQV